MRTINVNGNQWKYKVGRRYIVAKCGKYRFQTTIAELLNITSDDMERARHKRTNLANVTQSEICEWIKRMAYDA